MENARPRYYEVGREYLLRSVEHWEALDFAFARRMQGLMGVGQEAVWACLDQDFNPALHVGQVHLVVHGWLLQVCVLGGPAGPAGRSDRGPPAAQGLLPDKCAILSTRYDSSDLCKNGNELNSHAFRDGPALL